MSERASLFPFGFFAIFWFGYGAGLTVAGGKNLPTGLVFLGLSALSFLVYLWQMGVRVTVKR